MLSSSILKPCSSKLSFLLNGGRSVAVAAACRRRFFSSVAIHRTTTRSLTRISTLTLPTNAKLLSQCNNDLSSSRLMSSTAGEEEPRESMPFDVLIVGGGPAGLAASIRIKQMCQESGKDLSVCLIDKGRYVLGFYVHT
jgi:hypothetical protein